MNAKLATLLAVILAAALLVPAAQAKQGGKGSDEGHGKPSWAGQGQAKKAEKASRKTERNAAKAAKAEKAAGKRAQKAEVGESEGEEGPRHDNPAWICKFERDMIGGELFGEKYGKNENQANAFGKCVSEEARARDGAEPGETQEEPSVCNPTDEAGDGSAKTESPESQLGALEEEADCPTEEENGPDDSEDEGTEMSATESLLTVLRVLF